MEPRPANLLYPTKDRINLAKINVLYTVNCGLVVWCEHTKLFIDGIHGTGIWFSSTPKVVLEYLHCGISPFDNINYLMFTHGHPDHFDLPETVRFLSEHPAATVVLPLKSGQPEETETVFSQLANSPTYLYPSVAPWKTCCYSLGDFKVTYINTPHIPAPLMPEYHYSILLQYEDLKIFIGGDLDFPERNQLRWLIKQKIDYAFFNPFFIFHRKGQQAIAALNLKMTYIYHIPYPEEGNDDLLVQIRKSMAAQSKRPAPVHLLAPGCPAFVLSKEYGFETC